MKKREKQKPRASCCSVFCRLFRQFACRYWLRLSLGILSGMVMGGSMHAFLACMDFGISSLESGLSNESRQEKKQNRLETLKNNKSVQWTLKLLKVELPEQSESKEITAEQPQTDNVPQQETKTEKNENLLFEKINKVFSSFGFKVSQEEAISFPLLCLIIIAMFFFFCLKAFGEFTNKYFLRWVGARLVTDIRAALFDNFQRQSMAYFSKNDSGQIISRCTNDASTIEHAFSNSIAEMFISPVQLLVACNFVIYKACTANLLKPSLILLVAMPIVFVPIYCISKMIRRYQHRVLDRVSLLLERMQENLNGIRVVKAYNREEYELQRFNRDNTRFFRSVEKSIIADIFMSPVMQMSAIAVGSAFLIVCYHYKVSLGTLAILGYAAQNAYKPIKELAKMNANLQKSAAAAERIFDALDLNTTLPEPLNPVHIDTLQHEIRFNNITFSYENSERPVLNDFTLDIPKGSLVAIVGPTGSGKSTLANLLPRFYDPQQGSVTIDGIDIRNITNSDLKHLIGIVSQDNFLFNETVAFNIGYGKPGAPMEEIQDAAKMANADAFIMEDPLGYQRPSGEAGCLLSGGQKQRIAIARAILKNPPILILDEATSALDTVTEQMVQQAITNLMKDRTVLAIAHRLSTVVNADKIVFIDNGTIVEQGTHQELYDKNGRYRQLYDMQIPPSSK